MAYADAAQRRGVGAVFAFPLHVGAARFGTLTAYAPTAQPLGTRRTACCLAMAEIATEALLDGTDRGGEGRLDPDLDGALGLRSEIYQAQGMVMVMLRTDLATALARMRAHAYGSDSQPARGVAGDPRRPLDLHRLMAHMMETCAAHAGARLGQRKAR